MGVQVSLPSADCLSLTIEEVMHIRRVLAKAELESLIVHPELYQLVSKGKVSLLLHSDRTSMFTGRVNSNGLKKWCCLGLLYVSKNKVCHPGSLGYQMSHLCANCVQPMYAEGKYM